MLLILILQSGHKPRFHFDRGKDSQMTGFPLPPTTIALFPSYATNLLPVRILTM